MRFGILAHSSEGAALCYLTFCREGFRRMGRHMHPEVMLDCTAMAHAMPAWEAGDLAAVRAIMSKSVERLAAGGCDFFACPDNTAHIALEADGAPLTLPGLNIADVVAERASAVGMGRVAVLGTRFTMAGPVYRRALPAVGIEPRFPNDEQRADIDRIIFDELVEGVFTEGSRRRYLEIIQRLKDEDGCDGVALVCTEIPLLVTPMSRRCQSSIRRDCWREQRSKSAPASGLSRRGRAARLGDEDSGCWLCSRPLGSWTEYHHPVPKSLGGRATVPTHAICHRTLHKTFSNAELDVFGDSVAAIRADPRISRFCAWIGSKDPDFHAPAHGRR